MPFLLPWLVFLCACAGRHVTIDGSALHGRPGRVALLPVGLAEPAAQDAFRDGTAIGHLTLSGGYVDEARAHGTDHVSAQVQLTDGDAYLARARASVAASIQLTLAGRGYDLVPAEGVAPSPHRLDVEGPYRGIGHDNQPLPRFTLLPARLPSELLATLPSGTDLVVVPWVVRFYSHTSGWFRGQTYGCASGARFRVLVAAYDPADGGALAWTDLDAVALEPETEAPTTAAIEALTAEAEARVIQRLERDLFR